MRSAMIMQRTKNQASLLNVSLSTRNGQTKVSNRTITRPSRKDWKKKWWVNQLPIVLWAYYTTPYTALGETPYSVTYGQNCHIVEIGILKLQIH